MALSRHDADLMLRKYLADDAPVVEVVLLSPSRIAKVRGRLSLLGADLVLTPEVESEEGIYFPLKAVRFEYADVPAGTDEQRAVLKERFEGVLSIISASGDRLYICEPKSV